METSELPASEIVLQLAKQHNVIYHDTSSDRFAKALTEISGEDDTCDLLVALKRAKKISDKEMSNLLIKHLREKKILKHTHV